MTNLFKRFAKDESRARSHRVRPDPPPSWPFALIAAFQILTPGAEQRFTGIATR